jgi:site-specific DNA-cytosine methylase
MHGIDGTSFTLNAMHGHDVHAVAHAFYSTGGTHGLNQQPEVCPAIKVGSSLGIPSPPAVVQCVAPTITAGNNPSRSPQSAEVTQQVAAVHAASMTVRRLTPRECERLQGFPDDYTLIPWRKKAAGDCPDGPRYKALGNSMAVNCMEWIGERIAAVEAGEDK